MRTPIDIPERELADAMRVTKARTKKRAILTILKDYNRRKRVIAAIKYLEKFKDMPTLEEMRAADVDRNGILIAVCDGHH